MVASTATSPSTLATAAAAAEDAAQLLERDLEPERVAGEHRAAEAALVDPGEEGQLAAVLGQRQDRDRAGLGERLDHQHARHDRAVRGSGR